MDYRMRRRMMMQMEGEAEQWDYVLLPDGTGNVERLALTVATGDVVMAEYDTTGATKGWGYICDARNVRNSTYLCLSHNSQIAFFNRESLGGNKWRITMTAPKSGKLVFSDNYQMKGNDGDRFNGSYIKIRLM